VVEALDVCKEIITVKEAEDDMNLYNSMPCKTSEQMMRHLASKHTFETL